MVDGKQNHEMRKSYLRTFLSFSLKQFCVLAFAGWNNGAKNLCSMVWCLFYHPPFIPILGTHHHHQLFSLMVCFPPNRKRTQLLPSTARGSHWTTPRNLNATERKETVPSHRKLRTGNSEIDFRMFVHES